ncbi:MAG TPA: hypothetical protein VH497_01810, partial [Vicinamibacterales bacterium]
MTTAVQADLSMPPRAADVSSAKVVADGKFLRAGSERFLIKGVTYGTFAPDADGYQFPSVRQIHADFEAMAELGINSVRTYTPPRIELLDAAAEHG